MARLLVSIDTEEEGLFGKDYPTRDWRVGHLAELPWLQSIFDHFGVRPTYQVTTPVIMDDVGSDCLAQFLDQGRCDIGAHLHPWATEPIEEPADHAHSMPCMLPVGTVRRKLTTLTRQIRDRFGIQPVIYRSGRYGSAAEHTPLLIELGYRVETSVCPFVSHAQYGGPDYFDDFYRIYARNMRDLGSPVLGTGFFRAILERFGADVLFYRATYRGKPIGAKMMFLHGNRRYFAWAATLREYRPLQAASSLQWAAIRDAVLAGCDLCDLGRSTAGSGHARFKSHFGAELAPLYWQYGRGDLGRKPGLRTGNEKLRSAIRLWKRLPLPAANLFGPWLARGIP